MPVSDAFNDDGVAPEGGVAEGVVEDTEGAAFSTRHSMNGRWVKAVCKPCVALVGCHESTGQMLESPCEDVASVAPADGSTRSLTARSASRTS